LDLWPLTAPAPFSPNIKKFSDILPLIEYSTHSEGMATYAPLEIRQSENAIDCIDYVVLSNPELMKEKEKEYFDIYSYFKNNPNNAMKEADWDKFNDLSWRKRLFYQVGGLMAKTIDKALGRATLVNLPPTQFINTYLNSNPQ
jgi:hypothetical protein